jgi:hypothetical protein
LGLSTSRALPIPVSRKESLSLPLPLALLDYENLTIPILMNLRGFRTWNIGLLPKGMPARLVFSTDCIRHLLKI